jgi:hypothetical protein
MRSVNHRDGFDFFQQSFGIGDSFCSVPFLRHILFGRCFGDLSLLGIIRMITEIAWLTSIVI